MLNERGHADSVSCHSHGGLSQVFPLIGANLLKLPTCYFIFVFISHLSSNQLSIFTHPSQSPYPGLLNTAVYIHFKVHVCFVTREDELLLICHKKIICIVTLELLQ